MRQNKQDVYQPSGHTTPCLILSGLAAFLWCAWGEVLARAVIIFISLISLARQVADTLCITIAINQFGMSQNNVVSRLNKKVVCCSSFLMAKLDMEF